jgi:4-alpha-glucanotransferase
MRRPLEGGRHAGMVVPLFSMPSARSWGIGEIPDVVPMADWLHAAGQDLLQLLPMCEMTPGGHSPYSALSAMALDPIFISLVELEDFTAIGGEENLDEEERALLARIRAMPSVDYDAVRGLKMPALQAAFQRFQEAEWRPRSARGRELGAYVEEQARWLDDFALFRALHARHSGLPWTSWPEGLKSRHPEALARARQDLAEEILFAQYLQWILETQWRRARERAGAVTMIGDLAFTVGWDSADVWSHQDSFDMTVTVGTPPDAFSADGQDWGLPAYRWDALRRLDFGWLRQRARRHAHLYDLCRLDHVVGFYRTYVRPVDDRPPHFVPAEEAEQLALGEQILRVFTAEGLRIIAEDLGTVPDFVRASLARHGIPGYRVLRWERAWKTEGEPFLDPRCYPPASVATSGTHDVDCLAEWWETLPRRDRQQLCRIPALRHLPDALSQSRYTAELRDALLGALFASGSDFVIVPIQDVFGWSEQINRPGTVDEANWTYRLPWPSDRLGVEPEAVERAQALRRWTEQCGRVGHATPSRSSAEGDGRSRSRSQ